MSQHTDYDALSKITLGTTFPVLVARSGLPIDVLLPDVETGPSYAGARRAISRGGLRTLGDLAAQTWGDLRDLPYVGTGALAEIESLCGAAQRRDDVKPLDVEPEGADAYGPLTQSTSPNPIPEVIFDPISVLTHWGAAVAGATTWREVAAALDAQAIPPDVLEALENIGTASTGANPQSAGAILREWVDELGARDSDILRQRVITRSATLDDIGTRHDVTRERIRQLESHLKDRLGSLLDSEKAWHPVRWSVFDLKGRVGSCAPISSINDLDLCAIEDQLLLHLAGLTTKDFTNTVNRGGFVVPESDGLAAEPDGVIIDMTKLEAAAEDIGVLSEYLSHLLTLLPVREIEGSYVLWPKNMVQRSIAHLAARQEPMGSEELFASSGGTSHRAWRNRVLEAPEIHRISRNQFALRSWGLAEYSSVVSNMLQLIDVSPTGSLWLRDLTESLERDFQISPMTTQAYSVAPAFVVNDGLIWRRSSSEPYAVPSDISHARGVFRTGSQSASWLLPVDGELARGSGRPAPQELAHLLRFGPGESVSFEGNRGRVRLNWNERSHMGPTGSSLRPLMQALEATIGDHIRLDFDRLANRVTAERVIGTDETTPLHDLCAATGLSLEPATEARLAIADAIGSDRDSVVNTLRYRGDDMVADLLAALG
ncbi:hypothetical protein K0651_07775 [Ornithinimicrobium sp. Arc0846-15]|nr:hypothetical protein [Ornithinimicrobium laminariae]